MITHRINKQKILNKVFHLGNEKSCDTITNQPNDAFYSYGKANKALKT